MTLENEVMSQALSAAGIGSVKSLPVSFIKPKPFRLTKTRRAFKISKAYTDWIPVQVQEEILHGMYLANNSKKIWKEIDSIDATFPELLRKALIGELANRLPLLECLKLLDLHDQDYGMLSAAQCIISILMDSKVFQTRTDSKTITVRGRRFTIPQHVILLHGETTKSDRMVGYERMPGINIQTHVGHMRLKKPQKEFNSLCAMSAFKVSHWATREYMEKAVSLLKDFNSKSKFEAQTLKEERYYKDIDYVLEIAKWDCFYMSVKLERRNRMGYYAHLTCIDPHGKLFALLNIDLAESYVLTAGGVKEIQHIIYCGKYGKTSRRKAVANFTQKDLDWAGKQDPLDKKLVFTGDRTACDEFGKRLRMRKCHEALVNHANGIPTHSMFDKDLTNSGLMIPAVSFHSLKQMKWANMGGSDTYYDSHGNYIKIHKLPLSRIDGKDLHQGVTNGEHPATEFGKLLKILGEDCDLTEEDVVATRVKAYGPEIHNYTDIALAGSKFVDNYNTVLYFKTEDNYISQHRACSDHVPLELFAPSLDHGRKGESWIVDTVVRKLPITFKGDFPLYKKGMGEGVYSKTGVVHKLYGLMANCTHTLETWLLRTIIRALIDAGYPFIMKHDNYITQANAFELIVKVCQGFFCKLYKKNYYQEFLNQIMEASDGRIQHVPQLLMGKAKNTIRKSFNFLMP